MSEDSLEERRAAQRGSLPRSSLQKGSSLASHSLTASERAYSVAAAAGLILDTPPLRRIYSMPHNASRSLNVTFSEQRCEGIDLHFTGPLIYKPIFAVFLAFHQ